MKYEYITTQNFEKKSNKLKRTGRISNQLFSKVIEILITDPFDSRLRTHKVYSRHYKQAYSSRINGDIRIIWKFDENNRLTLLFLDIGGHSGANTVYDLPR